MNKKNIFSNYIVFTIVLLLFFVVIRLVVLHIYSYPFNLYCSDSITYLRLASDLGKADANRPSGYPAILRLILPMFYKNWYTLLLLQAVFSFSLLCLSLLILKHRFSKSWVLVWICLVFFNFQAIFMEKSIMSDSVSYNLLVFGALIIISGLNRSWKYILVGTIAGLFPLLRTNYLIFSLLLVGITTYKLFFSRENIKTYISYLLLLCVPFLVINSLYITIFVYPKLGVKQISSFGGRALFSRIMEFTSCDKFDSINVDYVFLKTLKNTCKETGPQDYSEIMFSDTGLIYKVNNTLNLDRAKSDTLYLETSKQLLLKDPQVIVKIFSESIQDTFTANNSFYESNRYPKEAGCAEYLDNFGIDYQVYIHHNAINFNNQNVLFFALLAAFSQKIIILVMYIIIPIWLLIRGLIQPRKFIKMYGELLIIWFVAVVYFTLTIIFAGADYRYPQPLWLLLAWGIFVQTKIK